MVNFKEQLKVDLKTAKLTEREARQAYEKFVLEQQEQFVLFINHLNSYINDLREQGVISPFLKFYARIKATNSALRNYQKKALDDIFGIEFIGATDTEIEILQQKLEKKMDVHKVKKHDKENGYKATHHACSVKQQMREELIPEPERQKERDNFPIIEVQYKTIDVYYKTIYGEASHEKYKDAKIPQLQALYDNDSLTVGEYIPYMWASHKKHNNMREMTTEEVLKKMYPSLDLRKNTEKEQIEER